MKIKRKIEFEMTNGIPFTVSQSGRWKMWNVNGDRLRSELNVDGRVIKQIKILQFSCAVTVSKINATRQWMRNNFGFVHVYWLTSTIRRWKKSISVCPCVRCTRVYTPPNSRNHTNEPTMSTRKQKVLHICACRSASSQFTAFIV